jgi:UDP-N-acetylglucosamine 2-epimerase (non-hydrolysing)
VENIVIDSFAFLKPKIQDIVAPARFGVERLAYGVVTLHRPSNVDTPEKLALIVQALETIAAQLPLVFPVHPRTRQRFERFGLLDQLKALEGIKLAEPLSYIEFMSLVIDSRLVLTDSGEIQEETSYLGVPCLTLRDNTERPVTVTAGTNRLIKAADLRDAVDSVLGAKARCPCTIDLWDGRTAARVADSLARQAKITSPPIG